MNHWLNVTTGDQNINESKIPRWWKLISEWFELAQLPEKLRKVLSDPKIYDAIDGDDWTDAIDDVVAQLLNLDESVRSKYKEQIKEIQWRYAMNAIMIRHYTRMEKYKDNPRQLLADIRWVDVSKLVGNITADIDITDICFYIENWDDAQLLYGKNSSVLGWAGWTNRIRDLNNCCRYVIRKNISDDSDDTDTMTKIHEQRHTENKKLDIVKLWVEHSTDAQRLEYILERWKDEIIAHLTDWNTTQNSLFRTLTEDINSSDDGDWYDYIRWLKTPPENMATLVVYYNDKINTLIGIALACRKANIPNYLDLLAILPTKYWHLLQSTFLNPKWHIKYAKNRTIPFYFGKDFWSIQDEQKVLKEMYKIAPAHVIRHIYSDPKGAFYISEKFWSNNSFAVRTIPDKILTHIKEVIRQLHKSGIAHGDIAWNILFEVDENGVVKDFKFMDPVGISISVNDKYLQSAIKADNEALEKIWMP